MQAEPHEEPERTIGKQTERVIDFVSGGEPSRGLFDAEVRRSAHIVSSAPGLRRFFRIDSPWSSMR
jgi:hypothetical protein